MSTSLAPPQWPSVATATSTTPPVLTLDEPLVLVTPTGEEHVLVHGLTIGQIDENHVVLRDPCVSRRHCVVERERGGLRVRDLGSKNGTLVNGVRVSDAPLDPGAVISIGGVRLRVIARSRQRSPLVGSSASMRSLRRQVALLAPTGLPVLVLGETGTGKELVARALHDESRLRGQFIALNCGAIAHELVESELFGHEKGAFTGAIGKRLGVFQDADGGTLFLDEVAELPLSLQPKLLRALEARAVRPVGATREVKVDVRVVAATHVELEAAVRRGAFREDLYYRLCGDVVRTPALREHPTDIPELAARLLVDEGLRAELSEDVIAALVAHEWKGNVRELRNVVRRAALLCGGRIRVEDLRLGPPQLPPTDARTQLDLDRTYLELERDILARTIDRHGGNKRAAAQALGIPKSTLCDKAKRYGIR
ncbi:MAG: sigma 54-interacting transcriptional regulator [Polyangia bacterium]